VTDGSPTVALIHATPASMGPARTAFAEHFPQAQLWNLLDDLLISQAEAAGGVSPPLRHRMLTLIRHAVDGGADAVLLSCSMYGPVAVEVASLYGLPVLASDQALFDAVSDQVARSGATRIAVLGPVPAGVQDTVARLRAHLVQGGNPGVRLDGVVVPGARDATTSENLVALERVVVAAAQQVEPDTDIIVLGQFSIAPAQPAAQAAVSVPVLSPPQLAADVLRAHLTTQVSR